MHILDVDNLNRESFMCHVSYANAKHCFLYAYFKRALKIKILTVHLYKGFI